MARMDIAVDMGTSYTSIFVAGNGIVLHEPSVIAYYDNNRRTTRAVGDEAYAMLGRAPEKTKIVYPISEGVIIDPDACAAMLKEFIKKILPDSYVIKPKIHAVLAVPTGIKVDELKMYEEVLMRADVDEISMVNAVMLAGIGAELPVASAYGGLVASIGGGLTQIGVLSLCGIESGYAVNIAGDMIDRTVSDSIRGRYLLKVDLANVRKIKEETLSLIRNDRSAVKVSGINLDTKAVERKTVLAEKIYGAVYVYYKNIIGLIDEYINSCKPAIASEIQKSGITVVGGAAKIPGLAELMSESLGIRVKVLGDPEYAVVLGGGKLLSDRDLLDDILLHA